MRTNPDPLTIAYIAIGAHRRLRVELNTQRGEMTRHDALIETYSGELGIIDSCIDDALMLDQMQDKREAEGKTGNGYVFAYEVAEEYGYYLVDRMLANHKTAGRVPSPTRREIAASVFEAAAS